MDDVSEQVLLDALEELKAEFEEMEMATNKSITKVSDKLTKVNESFTINRYDNGYMLEISGRNKKGDYQTAKIMVATPDELVVLVREALDLDLDN